MVNEQSNYTDRFPLGLLHIVRRFGAIASESRCTQKHGRFSENEGMKNNEG